MTAPDEGTGWLIDKSALVGLGASADAEVWADRIERGLVRIATVTLLEVGYSARSAADLRAGFTEPPIASMPVIRIVALVPASPAAMASAWAWLPEEDATTPRASSRSDSEATLL